MKSLLFYACLLALVAASCKSSKKTPFCADSCLKDTVKFTGTHELHPYVYITAKDCHPDSIIWSYAGMGVNRKTGFSYLLGTTIDLAKDKVRSIINDTAYAWLLFNDCKTQRGFQVKLPYNKGQSFSIKSSGINNLDPKFSVDPNMIAYTDRGNIYVEDAMTGKKAMMTFGKALEIDYDEIHDWIDTVNVTPARIWVKVKVDGKWKELNKDITLE